MEPTRPVPPRTIQTRTQTALEQGVPRRRFSQFGYPSESDSQAEAAGPPPMTSPSQVVFPEVDDLEPLFSDQDEILPPTLIESLIPSPSGTSAPLLSNPSLTDTLSNFSLFNQQTRHPNEPTDPIQATEPLESNDGPDDQIANPNPPPTTTTRRGRPRGRPLGRRNQLPTSSSRTTTSSRKPTTRPRRGPRTRFSSQSTAKIILNKWFARHGTPARMQSDNATKFTAEIAQELMKASQVTKVTSTPAHPRGNGLVERQNRNLLTLLRVYTSRRMQDWDEHIDGVLGAYNSTRHATTGFSPYMLHHGAEKSIPLSFIYPEFAARGFDSKEEFVEHLLARQQEIHELVRRNTHQAQLRQKLKFDRHLKAKAHAVGDAVWVFCHINPKGGTRKLIRAWRGPHKVTDVLQDGRLYVLDTGQKVHYERLKKHVPAPWDWTTHQPF